MKAISPVFRLWDSQHANINDTAKGDCEAEYALYCRQIVLEQSVVAGLHFVQFLFDFQKYYDSISLNLLLPILRQKKFPKVAGALAFQGHWLPRRIVVQDHFGYLLSSFAFGIVAGCTSSTSLARAQVNFLLEEVQTQLATLEVPCDIQQLWFQHVDDISH